MKYIIAIVLTAMLSTSAIAHSKVAKYQPQDGASLAEVPAQIELEFTKDIRLTKVELSHKGDPVVAFDLQDYAKFSRSFSLPLTAMGAGAYLVQWRGLGNDGHVMQGKFEFTVE